MCDNSFKFCKAYDDHLANKFMSTHPRTLFRNYYYIN